MPEHQRDTGLLRDALAHDHHRLAAQPIAVREIAAGDERNAEDAEKLGRDDAQVAVRVVFAAALRRLTPKQRAILVLRYFEDYSEAQTAELLGIAIGTVKSQTAVSLRRLRELAPELGALINADSK